MNEIRVDISEENGISLVFHRNTLKSNYVDYVDYYVAGHLLVGEHYGV